MASSKVKKSRAGASGLDVFDTTLHKTNLWLKEIMAKMGVEDRHLAYIALRSALHALRDRLTVAEATQLGAQLPMLIRGLYYEGWTPAKKPVKWDKAAFLASVRAGLRGVDDPDPEQVARAVFSILGKHVSAGEMRDVKNVLPRQIRALLGAGG
jgi:uncharacterized protein (DUF2267 family)